MKGSSERGPQHPRADGGDRMAGAGNPMPDERRGKAVVLVLVIGGTLLAVGATVYIILTWGR